MKTTWLTVVVLSSALTCGSSTSPSAIATRAENKVGSTDWSYSGCHRPGCNKWKCNTFVAEMIEAADATLPHRHRLTWSPIGANEWANPRSRYLTRDSHWTRVTSPARGDIAADGGHVGIVSRAHGASKRTISATQLMVVSNDWGFRAGQSPTFWRYSR